MLIGKLIFNLHASEDAGHRRAKEHTGAAELIGPTFGRESMNLGQDSNVTSRWWMAHLVDQAPLEGRDHHSMVGSAEFSDRHPVSPELLEGFSKIGSD
jgi:hypothetical protein